MSKKKNKVNQNKSKQSNTLGNGKGSSLLFRFPAAYLLIAAFVFALYFQTFSFELGKLDDKEIILNNAPYLSNFSNIFDSFGRDAFMGMKSSDFYRPLQNMSFFIDYAISGKSGYGYALMNLLIHLLTCFAVFELLSHNTKNKNLSFLLTLFFASSPVFIQAISWAPGRGDLLIGLFGVLSVLMLSKYYEQRKNLFLVLSSIFYALALLSKETGIALLGVFAVMAIFERKEKFSIMKLSLPLIFDAVLSLIYLSIRSKYIISDSTGKTFGISSFISNLQTIPEITAKFISGYNLSPLPVYDALTSLIGLALLALIITLIIKNQLYKNKLLLTGASIFLFTLIPGMFYTHQMGKAAYDYLEHRAYLPSAGLLFVLAIVLNSEFLKKQMKTINIGIMVFIAFFAIYGFSYQPNYKNGLAFYDYVIAHNTSSAMAYNNRGNIYLEQEKNDLAESDLKEAIKLYPNYPEALNNLGMVFGKRNKIDTAFVYIRKALSLNPNYGRAYNNLGIAKCITGQFQSALGDFDRAISLVPYFGDAYCNRGNAKHALKDVRGACLDWSQAVKYGNKEAINMLGRFCNGNLYE